MKRPPESFFRDTKHVTRDGNPITQPADLSRASSRFTLHASRLFLGLIILLLPNPSRAQLTASAGGYLSNMQSVMFERTDGNWTFDNLIHNRLNFKLNVGRHLDAALELRNRFISGETVKYLPGYAAMIGKDNGWADMSWNLASDTSFILNSTIDRAYINLNLGKFQVTAGRQRINWGMNFVWNPNDIFNAYSYFDFDYVERPGSDALRLQYYFSPSTHLELAGKMNSQKQYSLAGLFRFSLKNFDIQVLGGVMDEDQFVAGGGFSGNIGPVSLTGEITRLVPKESSGPLKPATIAGMGFGYLTPFQLNIQGEYLFNGAAGDLSFAGFTDFYYRSLTIRDLSFAPHTFFANVSYPVTPLFNAGLAFMFFPKLQGFFTGPTLDLSLTENLDLSLIVQYFSARPPGIPEQKATLGFLRLKWSF